MFWANFLHFYQPAFQQPDILEAVVAQSYRPLLLGLKARPKVKITLNVNGALLELFDRCGFRDLIDTLRFLGGTGAVEFTSSAKYHALLPFLSAEEMKRQIQINDETNRFFLGDAYAPAGFFPPEMGYNREVGEVVRELGFRWIILDEIAAYGEIRPWEGKKVYRLKGTGLLAVFRQRRLSNLIMSAVVRDGETLRQAMREELGSNGYIITAMDGETFGHHRPGLEKMLFNILDTQPHLATVSEILAHYKKVEEIEPVASTWASSKEEIDKGTQFASWSDPGNQIHVLQKRFVDLAVLEFGRVPRDWADYPGLRAKMDVVLSSDHFFWASGRPWWSLEMIEDGAYRLLSFLREIPAVAAQTLGEAGKLYELIVSLAFDWQRSGKIRKMAQERDEITRIPFRERTIDRAEKGEPAEAGVYHAFVTMMKRLEKQASRRGEYEQAILWRDAIYKLEKKLDIYDTINAIDLLRVKIPHAEVEKTVERYKEKYRRLRGGQPEQRD